jgi:hypothetical protein
MNKGGTVVFYTLEQIEELTSILKEGNYSTLASLSRVYSKKWGKTPKALCQRIRKILETLKGKEPVNYRARNKAKQLVTNKPAAIAVQPEVGVELPKGMTFEGTPRKVILYKDHFRVYL